MTAGGKIETPVGQRIFWCIFLGLLGVALMLGGGLTSLQALALASAFPFSLVMLLMMVSLYRGLRAERQLLAVAEAEAQAQAGGEGSLQTRGE
jgi:BCCT family betaine/carnitine transporter